MRSLSAWVALQALVVSQVLPPFAWGHPPGFSEGRAESALRASQRETAAGLEEVKEKLLSGLEQEPETVEEAAQRWFHPKATRADEVKLQEWLAARGEEAIHEFMRAIAQDRGIPVEELGPYRIPAKRIDADQLLASLKQHPEALQEEATGRRIKPERYYEHERLKLMAAVAIQRALGRRVLVEIGMGYVGIASGLVHSNTVAGPAALPKAARGKKFRSPIRKIGMQPYFVIWYQRPGGSFYKILHARGGVVPLPISDPNAPLYLRKGLDQGTLFATPLAEAIAAADLVLGETELAPLDRVPDDPSESRIDEEATLRLLDRAADLVPNRDTLILIVSTVTPGFTRRAQQVVGRHLVQRGLISSIEEAPVAHAPTRLQPGTTWTRWVEFQRLAAAATKAAEAPLHSYLDMVYSPENRARFGVTEAPPPGGAYRIHEDPLTIEVEKSWENFWRGRLYELGVFLLQLADELGFNAWEVAREIARARPATHGLTDAIAHLVGGFCVTNQDKQILSGLWNELTSQPGRKRLAELELQRYFRSTAMAKAVLAARARDFVMDYLLPALERGGRRPDRYKLLLGGVAYRGETDETRQSGPEAFLRHARDIGGLGVEIFAADPFVRYWLELAEQDLSNPGRIGYGMRHQQGLQKLRVEPDLYSSILERQPDAIVMTTRHLQYLGKGQPEELRRDPAGGTVHPGLDPIEMIVAAYARRGIVLGDTFDFFSDSDLTTFLAHGWEVFGVGKGHIRTRLRTQIPDGLRLQVAQEVLGRLQQKLDDPRFDRARLEQAIQVQQRQLQALRLALAASSAAGLEETPELAQAQADLASVEQELSFEADPDRRAVLSAQAEWLGLKVRFLKTRDGNLQRQAQEAQAGFERKQTAYRVGGTEAFQREVSDRSLLGLSRRMTGLMRLLNALAPRVAQPEKLILPDTTALLAKAAQDVDMVFQETRTLNRMLDRLAHAFLSDKEKQALAHELRIAEIPADLTVPDPLPPAAQKRLKARYRNQLKREAGVQFVPAFTVTPGEGNRFEKRVASNGSTMVAVIKFPPDMEKSDEEIKRREWGKHMILTFPNEADAEILEFERYPDFEGLPWEFRLILEDLVRRERVLTTLEGTPQNRIGWVMPVNLDEQTPDHRRGRLAFPFFADNRQLVAGAQSASGAPMIVEWKGTGPHVGGAPAGLKLEKAVLRAGGGGRGVGRQEAWQVPGQMSSGEEVITLSQLRRTDPYQTGNPAPPVPLARIRFRFKSDPGGSEYEIVLRGGPSSRRLMHRLVDGSGGVSAREAARTMGKAAAFLLGKDLSSVHIALNGDNLYDNGMPTDTASFVSVPDERDPKDAFFEYFRYQIKHMLYTFEQVDRQDWSHSHSEYLRDWLDGFFEHLLSIRGIGQVYNPEAFEWYRAISREELARMIDPEKELIEPLTDALWRHYLAYRVLEHRVALHGYDPAWESAYTTTHEAGRRTRHRPRSRRHALAFLKNHREALELAQNLIEKEKRYPPVAYVRGPRAGHRFDFKQAFRELRAKERRLARLKRDYSSIYDLSFYPPREREYYDVIEPGAPERIAVTWYKHAKGYEKPSTALQARARLQRQIQRQQNNQQETAGLEELHTLREWQRVVGDPQGSGFSKVLRSRYGSEDPVEEDPVTLMERNGAFQTLLNGARAAGFKPGRPIVVLASPGRDRIKGNHPDFHGNGGPSVNTLIQEEILAVLQPTDDGQAYLSNAEPDKFPAVQFPLAEARAVGEDPDKSSRAVWDRASWDSYVKGVIAHLFSGRLGPDTHQKILERLGSRGFRLHVGAIGSFALSSEGGESSSAALTGAASKGLSGLFGLGLTDDQLVAMDFAEYWYLGKGVGAADKLTQVEAPKGSLVVLSSFPDKILETIELPETGLALLRVAGPIPRLASDDGLQWLKKHPQASIRNRAEQIHAWAKETSARFGPAAYLEAVRQLRRNLKDPQRLEQAGVTSEEAQAVEQALMSSADPENPDGLLRELNVHGAIEQKLPDLAGWEDRHRRYHLVYRLLKLIDEHAVVGSRHLDPRKAALFGLAETERTWDYVRQMKAVVAAENEVKSIYQTLPDEQISPDQIAQGLARIRELEAEKKERIARILDLVEWSHDGDRANEDYRLSPLPDHDPALQKEGRVFPSTDWAGDPRNDVSDAAINRWLAEQAKDPASQELVSKPGGFERSIPDLDEFVTKIRKERMFKGKVRASVTGAGGGTRLLVHVDTTDGGMEVLTLLRQWLYEQKPGWQDRPLMPGAPLQVIPFPSQANEVPTKTAGLEEGTIQVDGTDVRVVQTLRLRAQGQTALLTLPNGSTLEAKPGAVVLIGPGTTIQSGVKVAAPAGKQITLLGDGTVLLTGTVLDGQIWVGRAVKLNAHALGRTWFDHGTAFTPGSRTVVEDSILAQAGGKPVFVKQATGVSNSVLWGSMAFQDAVVLDSIMHFALAGNHTLQSRSRLAGVSTQHRASAAHFNYLISMFTLPLAQWRDLSDPAQREEAFWDLAALRYGALVRSQMKTQTTSGHPSRPLEELTLSYQGQERTVLVRASNLGAGFGTSNFKPREGGGTKGPTLFWGGTMAGVGSYSTAPTELAPNSSLMSHAEVKGQVTAPGTLVVPEAAPPGKGVKEGRMDAREGRLSLGALENMAVRFQVMRGIEVLARVAAEGVSRAQSPAQRAGYQKEVELLQKFHAEAIADLKAYLAVVKNSAQLLQSDVEQTAAADWVPAALAEQKQVLGLQADDALFADTNELAPYAEFIADSSIVVKQAVETASQPPRYPMDQIVKFENPDGVFELAPGSPAMNGAVIADGERKVRERKVLGIVFAAGKGGRFKDSVAAKSPEYTQRAKELGRVDADGDAIKFAAQVGVSNLPAVLRQLEAFAELGFRSRRPFEVAVVDSAPNRQMLGSLMEEDRRSARPRIRWEYLNFVGARADGKGVLVNGATLQEVDPATGRPLPGTEVHHSHVPLVDQGEGLPATYAADVAIGGEEHKKGDVVKQWNPVTQQRDLPYKVPSGEYGALMAGANAARAAGIDVTRRDVLPTYGDQVTLYSDPDRSAALLGNLQRADVTGVAIPHRLVNEKDPVTGRPKWDPDGGIIVKAAWSDGETATAIAERDVRDPARAADQLYNPLLDPQELALVSQQQIGFPYNAAPPVFSASFMGDLLNARVDVRRQRKERPIQYGPGENDKQTVALDVTELEMTQLMQIASQQGRAIQVARVPREARQSLKGADDLAPADKQIFLEGSERLLRLLGDRLHGQAPFVEFAPGARGFFVTDDGVLTVSGTVGIEIDRWGLWLRRYEAESAYAGSAGIPNFSRERRLLIHAYSDGTMPLDGPVEINEQTYDLLGASAGLEEISPARDWAKAADALYEIPNSGPFLEALRELMYDSQMALATEQYSAQWGHLLDVLPPAAAPVRQALERFREAGTPMRSPYGLLLRDRVRDEGVLVIGEMKSGKSSLAAGLTMSEESGWQRPDPNARWELLGDDSLWAFTVGPKEVVAGLSPVRGGSRLRPSSLGPLDLFPAMRFVPVHRVVWLKEAGGSSASWQDTLTGVNSRGKRVYLPPDLLERIARLPRLELETPRPPAGGDSVAWIRDQVVPFLTPREPGVVQPTGLEELPPAADPLSAQYQPGRFVVASPAGSSQGTVYRLDEADPERLLADVKAGRRPTLLPKTGRVGTALWENVDHRELLQELYGYLYDIRDYLDDFPSTRARRVVELLHHEDQGVAAAARDVMVNARIFGLQEAVRFLADAYQKREGPPGPYAAFYFHDALTTRVDPVHKVEYGSPERNVFSGTMTPERVRRIHDQVKLWVDPKNKLSLFTGSGQRMVAPVSTANAGFKTQKDGLPTGFADPDLVGNDIGSQPHDAVLVVFALVAKLFAENMPQWRQEADLPMPEQWTVAIGSDGRSTTGAMTQVAARIFERAGVKVKMIGITSAPEAAARAYFSDPEENLLATFEITPSHINPAFDGTKLMLWMGQILPWTKAEEFNKRVQAAAQDGAKIEEVIRMLQDPDPDRNAELNRRVAEDLRRLPEEYRDSRRRYYDYLKRSWTGNWLGDETALERDWQALKQDLRERGIVGVLDLNGGARVTDLPLFDDLFDGRYIVMAPDVGSYHHALPPSRTAARPMMDFLARVNPVFEQAGLTLLAVMPDPDGDRKMMTYRDPSTGGFRYLDPQAGYLLDSMALVMAAREAGIPGIGIVSNSAGNPAIRFVLGDRLGAEVRFADVGEANVVQAITNLIGELAQRHGVDLHVDPSLPPQARALEIRKRLANKVSVGGGEPPAAAFIQGVMVRDMAQAFGTMFWFYRKPEWVRGLIEALVDDSSRKDGLLRQAEEIWRQPVRQQYLMHLLVDQLLPPMWSADPGDKTEKISAVRPENQQHFKNVMDAMLAPEGAWVTRIRQEAARIVSEQIDRPVSAEQITVSEPINYNEAFEVQGRGDAARTLPDGRLDPSGGYAVNISYRSSEGADYLIGTLWVRGSKTDIGVTRDLPMMTAPFLRPEEAAAFQARFRDAFHPLWTLFNYAAEAAELRGHVEGRFGGLDLPMLRDLTGSWERNLVAMRLVRNINYRLYGNPEAKDYSAVDAGNLGETDAAAQGAMAALQGLSAAVAGRLAPLRQMDDLPNRAQISSDEVIRIRRILQEIGELLSADFRQQPIGDLPSVAREAVAYGEAQQQVAEALRWKVERFLGISEDALVQGVRRLSDVVDDLQAFSAEGTTAQAYRAGNTPEQQNRGAAYANLVLDKIVLAREVELAQSAAGLEEAGEDSGVRVAEPAIGYVVNAPVGLWIARFQPRVEAPYFVVAAGLEEAELLLDVGIPGTRIVALVENAGQMQGLAGRVPGDQIFRADQFSSWESALDTVWRVAQDWLAALQGVEVRLLSAVGRTVAELAAQLRQLLPPAWQKAEPITFEKVQALLDQYLSSV